MDVATPAARKSREKLPPSRRRRFLCTDEAIRVLGAKVVMSERRRMERERKRLASDVPSAAWFDAVDNRGEEFPPGARETLMIVSVVSGRYTPPNNLGVEDRLDGMTALAAFFYEYPESPSAKAIRDIAAIGAHPVGGWT